MLWGDEIKEGYKSSFFMFEKDSGYDKRNVGLEGCGPRITRYFSNLIHFTAIS